MSELEDYEAQSTRNLVSFYRRELREILAGKTNLKTIPTGVLKNLKRSDVIWRGRGPLQLTPHGRKMLEEAENDK